MKPLEPGCLALVTGGAYCGDIVEVIALDSPPKTVMVLIDGQWRELTVRSVHPVNSDGTVWYVRRKSSDSYQCTSGGIKFNCLKPTKHLMRIDPDAGIMDESNPYEVAQPKKSQRLQPHP